MGCNAQDQVEHGADSQDEGKVVITDQHPGKGPHQRPGTSSLEDSF